VIEQFIAIFVIFLQIKPKLKPSSPFCSHAQNSW
jgi:hypothetical protein